MATKDLHHCAQLLSQMLDKDTGSVNSRGGIQAKRITASSTSPSSKPFITTGRLSRKSASKLSKSKTSKPSGKPIATSSSLKHVKIPDKEREQVSGDGLSSLSRDFLATQGSQQQREDLKKSIFRFLADQNSKMSATAQKGFRTPGTDREPSSKAMGGHMSPPAPVLYNHRLACSTPTESSKRLVDLGNTLILNGSTSTQILNATDEVQMMLKPEKKEPGLKLVSAKIDIVKNPSTNAVSQDRLGYAAPLSSAKKVDILDREGYVGDLHMKQMFKSPNKNRELIGSQNKSLNNPLDITVKSVAVGNSRSSTGLGNSMHSTGVGNSMHSIGVGNSVHKVRVGNSMHSVGVGNSMHNSGAGYSMHSTDEGESTRSVGNSIRQLHPTEEKSVKHCEKLEILDVSQFDRKHFNGSYNPSVVNRKSGSMVDLSSDRTGTLPQSNSSLTGSTSMNLHQTLIDSSSGTEKRHKESARYRSLTVGSGDHDFDACGDDLDVEVEVTGQENSKRTRLVMLLRQVKDVISEKQNCRISRLINEIQDVVSNTPTACAIPLSTDIETDLALQPLRSENAQLRRRVRILNQQLREKENLLETVEKPEPSFQVLHLSMLNQHLEKELGNLKEEIYDLRQKNHDLQEEFDKVIQEKADMLQIIAKKDDDHIKSLQEKMHEISRAKEKAEDMQRERQTEVERLRKQVTNLEFDLTQKDKEIEQAQNLTRGLQGSMSRLVHDLQSSRLYPVTMNSGNLSETLKSVKHLIGLNLNNAHSAEDCLSSSCTTTEQHGELQCPCVTMPKSLNFSGEMQKNAPSNLTQSKNSLSSNSTENQSRRIQESDTRRFEESNTRRIEEWKRQTEAAWPSTGITVKELLNPDPGQALYSAAHAESNDFDSFKSFSDIDEDHESTLVEVRAHEKVDLKVTQNGPDLSRHSITDYFQKYHSSTAFNAEPNHDRELTRAASPCSPESSTYSGSYPSQSFPDSQAEDEAISIHMSDFNDLSDRHHSSDIDSALSDFEGNAVTQEKDTQARDKKGFGLNLPVQEARDSLQGLGLTSLCMNEARSGLALTSLPSADTRDNKQGLGLTSFRINEARQGLDLTSLPIREAKDTRQGVGLTSLHMNEAGQSTELDLASLYVAETESTGTTCTFSSLGTISSVDDQAFKESLASLDANIALIQENLRRDLAVKYPTLANSS